MSLPKKAIVSVAVYLVLLMAFFVLEAGFPIRRREFNRAYIAWLDSPNPQTKSMRAQSRKSLLLSLEGSGEAALVLWAVGLGSYEVIRRVRAIARKHHLQTGTRMTSK